MYRDSSPVAFERDTLIMIFEPFLSQTSQMTLFVVLGWLGWARLGWLAWLGNLRSVLGWARLAWLAGLAWLYVHGYMCMYVCVIRSTLGSKVF